MGQHEYRLKKHLTPENAAELFELCAHRSARKVEELLAARFPRPDVRDLVRRLTRFAIPEGVPAQARLTPDVERASEKMPSEAPPCAPTSPLQQPFVESRSREPSTPLRVAGVAGAAQASKPGRFEPLSADRYGVHFTADGEFRELLERVRGLAGHRLPSGDLMTLLKHGLEAYQRELTRERFALGRKPRRSRGVAPPRSALPGPSATSETDLSVTDLPTPKLATPDPFELEPQSTPNPSPSPSPKRHVPAAVARAVFVRDGSAASSREELTNPELSPEMGSKFGSGPGGDGENPLLRRAERSFRRSEHFARVHARIDVGPHANDLAIGAHEESHPRAHPHRTRHAIGSSDSAVCVRNEWEGQRMLGAEVLVDLFRVPRDAEDGHLSRFVGFERVAEGARLFGATGRSILRVEVDDGRVPSGGGQCNRTAIGRLSDHLGRMGSDG
jgi:hypothetical protein